jgi:NAD(P)-dependent dehydrogenase (short-subunit alcohol dehydrogenase family)
MMLDGKVALITGASRGLGRAVAMAFAREGARLVLCSRSERDLDAVAQDVQEVGSEAAAFGTDVARPDHVERLTRGAEDRFGGIDVVVNNASLLGSRTCLEETPPEEFRQVLEVNLFGAFLVARAAVPLLKARGNGSIINVSSGVGNDARPYWGAYCASKFGLEALTGILAGELEGTGVRVNTVDPGRMRTSMRAAAYPDEDPATLPEPIAITPVFLYLASDRSRGVTGQRFRAPEWHE